jgi:RIO kinase 1
VRKSKEEWKIYKNVFDQFTINIIFKLITQGHFEGLSHEIEVGKESNVFLAKKGSDNVIVKIYRLESCNFNKMYDYIKSDPRFRIKKQRRKVIFTWVQREYRNLLIARDVINVPTPYAVMNNVLVMQLIGEGIAAPQVKDNPPQNVKKFFDMTITAMKNLHNAGLVHGDLSEFNILNYKETPYFIDFSQGTSVNDPNSKELLLRDVNNICHFFRKHGLKAEPESTLKKILS